MRHPRLLIGLLVLATVLVDLVVLSMVSDSEDGPTIASILGLKILIISQTGLAAIWVGYGGKWMPWTTLFLVLNVVALGKVVGPPESFTTVVLHLSLQAIAIVISLGLARFAGVRLTLAADGGLVGESSSGRQRFQFSLGYLFSWLTAVAVALSIGSYAIDYAELASEFSRFWQSRNLVPILGPAAVSLSVFWALLGTRRLALRIVTLFVVLSGTIWAPAAANAGPVGYIVLVLSGQTLWLAGSLAVVRVAGYRLVRASTRS